MSENLFRWVFIYAKEVRSKVSGDERDLVFLSWNGEQLCSSQINKAIKSIWMKAEVSGNPSSTLFRKSAVSGFHKVAERSEMCDNLADLMGHNLSTAQKYYIKLQEKSMASVKASKQLKHVMHGVSPVAENSEQESTFITEECSSVVSKHFWTTEKESLVKAFFGEEIKNKVITLEVVKEKISNHPELKGDGPKKVLDKVRSLWKYKKPQTDEPEVLPTEEESAQQRIERLVDGVETSSDMIPPTFSSGVRNVLSDDRLICANF